MNWAQYKEHLCYLCVAHIEVASWSLTQEVADESVGIAVKLVRETKIWLYIHYIYSHTTNLNES